QLPRVSAGRRPGLRRAQRQRPLYLWRPVLQLPVRGQWIGRLALHASLSGQRARSRLGVPFELELLVWQQSLLLRRIGLALLLIPVARASAHARARRRAAVQRR